MSDIVTEEREWFKELLEQLKNIHSNNQSVVTVLEFIDDCIIQRSK